MKLARDSQDSPHRLSHPHRLSQADDARTRLPITIDKEVILKGTR